METLEEALASILRGNFSERNYGILSKYRPKKKLYIFVSSTFTDTYRERSILHEQMLPLLQDKAGRHDVQVLFYDMRFGIKDESSKNHSIWKTCQAAIKECHEESDGLFFVSLQGEKYGYRPLPKDLQEQCLDVLQFNGDEEEVIALVKAWYLRNDNLVPARYELKDLASPAEETEYWNTVLPKVRGLLSSRSFDAEHPLLLIDRSITEWETLYAEELSQSSNEKNCLWVKRVLDPQSLIDLRLEAPSKALEFCDSLDSPAIRSLLLSLHELLQTSFDSLHPVPLEKLSVWHYINSSLPQGSQYLEKWRVSLTSRLLVEVENCVAKETAWNSLLRTWSIGREQMEEVLHHFLFATQKATSFIGREELVRQAELAIAESTRPERSKLAVTVAVIGKSGAGKTALMTLLAARMSLRNENNIPILMRFCGTSRYSLHGRDLIQSITLQLYCIYGKIDDVKGLLAKVSGQKYEDAVKDFAAALNLYPAVLFIDSLDQLSDQHQARSTLSFLQGISLHERSKIIVSTLPDDSHGPKYGCEHVMKKYPDTVRIVEMNQHTMGSDQIRATMEILLSRRGRRITSEQMAVLLNAAAVEPTMLYLNLSLEILSSWRSWDSEVLLEPTVKQLINQIITGLEKQFGQQLVTFALSFITFSRDGMNDVEMKDCLSLQQSVFDEVCQYWSDVKSVPVHVWLRLKFALKPLLAEKEHGCVKWYHRQLWEAAQERYQTSKATSHQIMAKCFGSQSRTWNGTKDIWDPESKVNERRAKEYYFHLVQAGMYREAAEEICALESVCAAALANDLSDFVSTMTDLSELEEKQSFDALEEVLKIRVNHYCRWLRKEITSLKRNPRLFVSCTASAEPNISVVRIDSLKTFESLRMEKVAGHWDDVNSFVWIDTINGWRDFPKSIANFVGHSNLVTAVAWHPDGKKIASGSYDQSIIVWDISRAEKLLTLHGHTGAVNSLAWSSDGKHLCSGSHDKTVRVWDAETGSVLSTFEGHNGLITQVLWSQRGVVVSSSEDKTVKIWDVDSAELKMTFDKHQDAVSSVNLSPDGMKVASGSTNNLSFIWNPMSGEVSRTLIGEKVYWHAAEDIIATLSSEGIRIWNMMEEDIKLFIQTDRHLVVLSWHPKQRILAAGDDNHNIHIWNANTGKVIRVLEGHTGRINALSWNHHGSKLASSSSDESMKLWDVDGISSANDNAYLAALSFCGHQEKITSITSNADNSEIVSASQDGSVLVWRSKTGDCLKTLLTGQDAVTTVRWSSAGDHVAAGGLDKAIRVWNSSSGDLEKTLLGHQDCVTCLSWHPAEGNCLASASLDETIRIWDVAVQTDAAVHVITEQKGLVNALAWNNIHHSGGSKLAAGMNDSTVVVWDMLRKQVVKILQNRRSGRITAVVWSSDDQLIATASGDTTVKIWSLETGSILHILKSHQFEVTCLAWCTHGSDLLVSGSADNTLKVWDASAGKLITTLVGHGDAVTDVFWSKDGCTIASSSRDRCIKIWGSFIDPSNLNEKQMAVGQKDLSQTPGPPGPAVISDNCCITHENYHEVSLGHEKIIVDKSYVHIKIVGQSASGVAFTADDLASGNKVCIKKVDLPLDDFADAGRMLKELKMMRHLGNHENVVQLLDLMSVPVGEAPFRDFYIVSRHFPSDLREIVSSEQPLTNGHIQYFLFQMLRGLKHLHSADIIHRDIKPSNCFVNADCELALGELGQARALAEEPTYSDNPDQVITSWYRAPELICYCNNYGKPVDLWSVGCVVAELLLYRPLFPGNDASHHLSLIIQIVSVPSMDRLNSMNLKRNHLDVIQRSLDKKKKSQKQKTLLSLFPSDTSPDCLDLLSKLLQFHPDDRITVEDALVHPYLKDLNDDVPEPAGPGIFQMPRIEHVDDSELQRRQICQLLLEEVRHFRPQEVAALSSRKE
eukprot:gene28059-33878_t